MTPQKTTAIIRWGLLGLVVVMPFHAFLSVWLGSLTGWQTIIQAWKELLLVTLALVTIALIWREPERLSRLRQPWIWLVAGFAVTALVVTAAATPEPTAIAFGLKTDLEFLLAAIIATLVATPAWLRQLVIVVLVGAAGVIGFGLLQITILPPDFLTHFGYGPGTIMPYQHITAGTDALRFSSTLGGPNQLGTYLILPLVLSLTLALRRRQWWWLSLTGGGVVVLFATHSRSAWLGATIALALTLILALPSHQRRRATLGLGGLAIAGLLLLPLALHPSSPLQYYLLHSSVAAHDQNNSDTQHADSLEQGVVALVESPLGHGLGTAGPATFHASSGHIIENYFLQLGYEAGLLGMGLFIAGLVALIRRLWRHLGTMPEGIPLGTALIGVSLAGLVLPTWTDSSTALIIWTTAGAFAGLTLREPAHV